MGSEDAKKMTSYNHRDPLLHMFYEYVKKADPDILYRFVGRIKFNSKIEVEFKEPVEGEMRYNKEVTDKMIFMVISFIDDLVFQEP